MRDDLLGKPIPFKRNLNFMMLFKLSLTVVTILQLYQGNFTYNRSAHRRQFINMFNGYKAPLNNLLAGNYHLFT